MEFRDAGQKVRSEVDATLAQAEKAADALKRLNHERGQINRVLWSSMTSDIEDSLKEIRRCAKRILKEIGDAA